MYKFSEGLPEEGALLLSFFYLSVSTVGLI